MTNRNTAILAIRPQIESLAAENQAEQFQNQSLRPVLKLQNELILGIIKHQAIQRKINLDRMDIADKVLKIKQLLKTESLMKQKLIGLIIGYFTTEEFAFYLSNENEINKRILLLMEERILSQVGTV